MSRDWVSFTFDAIREQGEDISIIYGRHELSGTNQWISLPHNQYDGIGGFQKLLLDHQIKSENFPVYKGDMPNFIRYVKGFFSTLPDAGVRQQTWKYFDRTRTNNQAPLDERIAYSVFSVEETRAIIARAKSEKVTANSYLLKHLDNAVRDLLVPQESKTAWVIPVNLRGAIERQSEYAPCMSFWTVSCSKDDTANSIHQQLNNCKNKHYHFGTWMLFNAGKVLGENAIRKDIKTKEKQNHSWTGTFSNLGSWTLSDENPWLFGPNIARTNPVAAGCVTINGRMSITLQLHAALGESLATAQTIVERWKQGCLGQTDHASHTVN